MEYLLSLLFYSLYSLDTFLHISIVLILLIQFLLLVRIYCFLYNFYYYFSCFCDCCCYVFVFFFLIYQCCGSASTVLSYSSYSSLLSTSNLDCLAFTFLLNAISLLSRKSFCTGRTVILLVCLRILGFWDYTLWAMYVALSCHISGRWQLSYHVSQTF